MIKPAPRRSKQLSGSTGTEDFDMKSPLGGAFTYPCRGFRKGPVSEKNGYTRIGNRELYMNCADIEIEGSTSKALTGKELLIANHKVPNKPYIEFIEGFEDDYGKKYFEEQPVISISPGTQTNNVDDNTKYPNAPPVEDVTNNSKPEGSQENEISDEPKSKEQDFNKPDTMYPEAPKHEGVQPENPPNSYPNFPIYDPIYPDVNGPTPIKVDPSPPSAGPNRINQPENPSEDCPDSPIQPNSKGPQTLPTNPKGEYEPNFNEPNGNGPKGTQEESSKPSTKRYEDPKIDNSNVPTSKVESEDECTGSESNEVPNYENDDNGIGNRFKRGAPSMSNQPNIDFPSERGKMECKEGAMYCTDNKSIGMCFLGKVRGLPCSPGTKCVGTDGKAICDFDN
ncbi:hypothetical protein L0F63_000839 [Massospora cicadina]|nr:hypothetical protein L0F63_000839 [Massospora cicadina]